MLLWGPERKRVYTNILFYYEGLKVNIYVNTVYLSWSLWGSALCLGNNEDLNVRINIVYIIVRSGVKMCQEI